METARRIIELFKSNWSSKEKLKYLRRKLEELSVIKEDICTQLEILESSSFDRKPKREVVNWLRNVERVKHKILNLETERVPNRWRKLRGARVKRLITEVDQLIEKSKFHGELVIEVCKTNAEPLPVNKLFGEAFQLNLIKIYEWLMNDQVLRIGIYGMGGVGKTTLVTHIYNLLVKMSFSSIKVYWITVSQNFSIYKLQDLIANVIKFNLDCKDDEKIRAMKLSKALVMKQKSVIILDDLWNQFSLEEVGIPMSCKLVRTTRSLDICRMMSCDEKIKLEPLLKEESWNLFVEKLGNYATLSLEVQKIAKSVVRECDGLPLGIITLARSMRGVDDVWEWRRVLEVLEGSIIGPSEMDNTVFKVLNLSYEQVRDPAVQKWFLYCALFPKDCEIGREELIDYLICEGFMKDLNNRQTQFVRGHTILNQLENACLLEGSPTKDYVKMHNLIRLMAINKMKRNPKTMFEAGEHPTYDDFDQQQDDYVKMHYLVRLKAIKKMKRNPKAMVGAGKHPAYDDFVQQQDDHDTVEDLGCINFMQVSEVSGKDDNCDCGENMQAYIGKAATHHSSEEDLINSRILNNRMNNKWDFELTDPITDSKGELRRQLVEKLNDQLWDACPLRSPSLNFRAEILVVLNLTRCTGALFWMGKQDLVSLKQIDLSYSSLIILPDLSRASKLRSLDLQSCNNLVEVSSIQYLIKLEYLNLSGCTSLPSLPSLMALKLLSSVHLSGCSKIRRLPLSLRFLPSLTLLDIRNCKSLQIGNSRLKSIQNLYISGCSMLMKQVSRSGTEEIPQSAMASSSFQSESINPGSHISSNSGYDYVPVSPQDNGKERTSCTPVEGILSEVKVLEDPLSATVASPSGRAEGIEDFLLGESSESLNQPVAQHSQKSCLESFMGASSTTADSEGTPSVRRKISSET